LKKAAGKSRDEVNKTADKVFKKKGKGKDKKEQKEKKEAKD